MQNIKEVLAFHDSQLYDKNTKQLISELIMSLYKSDNYEFVDTASHN